MSALTHSMGFALWLAITCGISFKLLPYEPKLTGNRLVSSLLFFNNLNIMISILEIILG